LVRRRLPLKAQRRNGPAGGRRSSARRATGSGRSPAPGRSGRRRVGPEVRQRAREQVRSAHNQITKQERQRQKEAGRTLLPPGLDALAWAAMRSTTRPSKPPRPKRSAHRRRTRGDSARRQTRATSLGSAAPGALPRAADISLWPGREQAMVEVELASCCRGGLRQGRGSGEGRNPKGESL
jgi:hypothetical protein